MHGLTGGDWKRVAARGTAPVPDPTHWGFDLVWGGNLGSTWRSRLAIMRV